MTPCLVIRSRTKGAVKIKNIKLIILMSLSVFCWIITPTDKVSAYPGGLLHGKPGWFNSGYYVNQVTDGDTNTYLVMDFGPNSYVEWVLDKPYTINKLRWKFSRQSTSISMRGYNSDGVQVGAYGVGSQAENLDRSQTVEWHNVTKVRVYNTTSNFRPYLHEFDVFGIAGPPPAPDGLSASPTPGGAVLSWTPVPDVSGYYIYHNGQKITGLITDTTYTVTGLADNVTHTWQVSAYNGLESELSKSVTTYTDTIPPGKPSLLVATPKPGAILLQWRANPASDQVSGYYVYRDGVRVTSVPVSSTSYTLSGIPDVSYSLQVSAVDAAGNESELSDTVTAAALPIPDTTPPAKPTGLRATELTGAVRLKWNANNESDLAGYYIYRNNIKINLQPITATNYNVTGFIHYGVGYKFEVSAVDKAGNESPKSDPVTAIPIKPDDVTPPAVPQGLSGSISTDGLKIILSWIANTDPDIAGYNLFVSTDGIAYQRVNADPIAGTLYEYGGIDGNTKYYFKLSAVDDSGNESKQSSPLSIKTPTRETSPILEPTKPKLIITWAPVHGAVQYLIFYQDELYAVVPSNVLQYEITLADGYDPDAERQKVTVQAKFIDGSIGKDPPSSDQVAKKWGFSPADVFSSSVFLVGALSGFVLFSLLFRFLPWIIRTIKDAASRRRAGA